MQSTLNACTDKLKTGGRASTSLFCSSLKETVGFSKATRAEKGTCSSFLRTVERYAREACGGRERNSPRHEKISLSLSPLRDRPYHFTVSIEVERLWIQHEHGLIDPRTKRALGRPALVTNTGLTRSFLRSTSWPLLFLAARENAN